METVENKVEKFTEDPTVYEILLSDGQKWVKEWATEGHKVKGFLIDATELNDIIQDNKASYVRVYFGINTDLPAGENEKMIMVPVDANGNDMINVTDGPNSNVFDFTLPCPPTCDVNSAIFKSSSSNKQ